MPKRLSYSKKYSLVESRKQKNVDSKIKWEKIVFNPHDKNVFWKDGKVTGCFLKEDGNDHEKIMVPFFKINKWGDIISLKSNETSVYPMDCDLKKYKNDVEKCVKDDIKRHSRNGSHFFYEIHVENYVGLVANIGILTPEGRQGRIDATLDVD